MLEIKKLHLKQVELFRLAQVTQNLVGVVGWRDSFVRLFYVAVFVDQVTDALWLGVRCIGCAPGHAGFATLVTQQVIREVEFFLKRQIFCRCITADANDHRVL